jgi:hypothetical protein
MWHSKKSHLLEGTERSHTMYGQTLRVW